MNWPGLGHASIDPVASFHEHGAAALGPILDAAQLAQVHAAIDAIVPEHAVTGGYASIVHDAWRRSAVLGELVATVGARACAAVGISDLVLFHDHVLVKHPDGEDMAWHQDFSYLPIDRAGGLTLWIALDDVTVDNGCLYYLLGSHHRGECRAAWGMMGDDDPRARLPAIDVADDEPGVPAPTAAGCATVHHSFLLHRSPKNASARARRTWALSFVSPVARWSPRHAPHPRSAASPRVEGQPLEPDLPRVRAAE